MSLTPVKSVAMIQHTQRVSVRCPAVCRMAAGWLHQHSPKSLTYINGGERKFYFKGFALFLVYPTFFFSFFLLGRGEGKGRVEE